NYLTMLNISRFSSKIKIVSILKTARKRSFSSWLRPVLCPLPTMVTSLLPRLRFHDVTNVINQPEG
ncbi:hypothetical protein PZE06_28210, partial [Robertmurraya sp. DFI.2.37]|uniref:hypothetical protein n=1 Tax=Robertmurraya sp. DFI.2.37 TaxID=3031819 RepID=UPI0023DB6F87